MLGKKSDNLGFLSAYTGNFLICFSAIKFQNPSQDAFFFPPVLYFAERPNMVIFDRHGY